MGQNRRSSDKEDPERTVRLPPIKQVVDRWFSDKKDGTEPPTAKGKRGFDKK